MAATITDTTLGLINQAESDLAAAQAGDANAAQLLATAQSAQSSATAAQATALQLHTVATQSAITALAALEAELQVPPGTPITPSVTKANFAAARVAAAQHPTITQALNLGIDWGTILSKLMQGGMAALQELVNQVLTGMAAPKPTA